MTAPSTDDVLDALTLLQSALVAKRDIDAMVADRAHKLADLLAALAPDLRVAGAVAALQASRDALAAAVRANSPEPPAADTEKDQ